MKKFVDSDAILDRLSGDLPYKASVKRVLALAPAADVVPVELLEKWLWEIAFNCAEPGLNEESRAFGRACEILTGRLDGLRAFVKDYWNEESNGVMSIEN